MFYRIVRALLWAIFRVLYRIRLRGRENLAYTGKMILVCNHISDFDAVVLHLYLGRKIYFMAKAPLFRFRPFGWVLRSCGAFPVERGRGDIGAIATAMEILEQDKTLGIFPEGKRNLTGDGQVHAFQHGAPVIALRSGARVLPVAVSARPALFKTVYVAVGAPIDVRLLQDPSLPHAENVRKITKTLHDRVAELKESVKQP